MNRQVLIITLVVVGAVSWAASTSMWVRQQWDDWTKPNLPTAENVNLTNATTNTNTTVNANVPVTRNPIPAEKNVSVPFTSQAPNANWDADHQEFCEEASVVMVGRFFSQRGITSAADAEAALQHVKQWELDNLGFFYDTTAAETAEIVTGVYGLQVELKTDPTITDIKQALADNKLVIVPAAGRELGNPNFTAPGPIYHNLVIRGYTKDGKFITNDPGTRKGEAYVYKQSVVMDAMHDWVPSGERTVAANGDATGEKVILIVSR